MLGRNDLCFELDFDLVDLAIQKFFYIKNKLGHYPHNTLKFGKGNIFSLSVICTRN